MMTLVRALSARKSFWEVVTAVLPIVQQGDFDVDYNQIREHYREVFAALDMRADSDRDIALLTGAVETAQWVLMSAQLADVDPELFWQNYLAQRAKLDI